MPGAGVPYPAVGRARGGQRMGLRMAGTVSALVALAVALGACNSSNDNPSLVGGSGGLGAISEVAMTAANGGQAGTTTLGQDPNLVLTVTIKLQNAPSGVQEPAAIHEGTCASF